MCQGALPSRPGPRSSRQREFQRSPAQAHRPSPRSQGQFRSLQQLLGAEKDLARAARLEQPPADEEIKRRLKELRREISVRKISEKEKFKGLFDTDEYEQHTRRVTHEDELLKVIRLWNKDHFRYERDPVFLPCL